MKLNPSIKLYRPQHHHRNRTKRFAFPSPFSVAFAAFLLLMALGAGDSAAECINPIALWKLEASGTTPEFQDEVNPGLHIGICREIDSVPVCPEAVSARYGIGQRFYAGGQLSGIDIPSSTIFNWDNTDSFSIAFWMKRDNTSLEENEVIIGRDSTETGNDLHWWIGVSNSGIAMANFKDKSDSPPSYANRVLRADKLLTDNRWHYIAFVRNGTTSEIRLYVDGQLEDKTVIQYSEDAFSADATPINIGWIKLDNQYQYKGMVDEIALYDVALPQWFVHDRYDADERYSSGQTDPCD